MDINTLVTEMLDNTNIEKYMNSYTESFVMLMALEHILTNPELTPENAARVDAWRRLLLQSMGKPSPTGGKRRSKKTRKYRK